MAEIKTIFKGTGYVPDARTQQAVRALLSSRVAGARALLVTGAPGTGKTALAEALAKGLGARFFYALLHSWSGADDLFAGVNVQAAVAGDAARVHQPGVLAQVAEASQQGLVVACLDELDKAPEATEALLLDWLQSGRVPVRPGEHIQTHLENVLVVITSNESRPHTDALIRRARRLRMQPMAEDLAVTLMARRSGCPVGACRLIRRVAEKVSELEETVISLQELVNAASEAWETCQDIEDFRLALAGWVARTPEGEEAILGPHGPVGKIVNGAWAEIARARKEGRA